MSSVPEDIVNKTQYRSGFVALIGRPNVGKSTLLNKLVGQKISITSPKPQTTRNRILGILTLEKAQILFVDTPGIHQASSRLNRYMVEQARAACLGVDIVLWLVDADRQVDTDQLIPRLLKQVECPVVLVINKIDKVDKEQLLPLIDAYNRLCNLTTIVPVSALLGDGLDLLLDEIKTMLPNGPHYYPEEQITDVPERFIAAEMIREQILNRTKNEVPYGVAVTIERFQENTKLNIVGIDAVINVERETQKRILVGKNGAMIQQIGQASRKEIERMLGVKVHLELFVRVQKNWTASGHMMKEFGYE